MAAVAGACLSAPWRGASLIAAWAVTAVVLVASLWPLSSLPAAPGGDKVGHLPAYAALAACWIGSGAIGIRRILVIAVACVALGMVIELVQPGLNRHGEWADVLANTLGTLAGSAAAVMVIAMAARKRGDADEYA